MDIDHALGKSVSRVFTWSVRHAKVILAVYLVATLAFGYGLTKIQVRSTDYDLMPDDHPSATANYKALTKIPGFRNADTMWIEVSQSEICDNNPDGTQTCHRDNITSERSIRGAQEAVDFVQAHMVDDKDGKQLVPYVLSMSYLMQLINYTASGVNDPACAYNQSGLPALPAAPPGPAPSANRCAPVPSAFALPPDSATFQRDFAILDGAAHSTLAAQSNENWTGAFIVFIYDINVTREGPSAVVPAAAQFLHAAEAWRDVGCPNMKQKDATGENPAFDCSKTYILGQSINGHMTELAQSDFETFGPIVFVATFFVLVLAFTDVTSMFIAFVSFCMGLVWTYGLMGYMGIPLTFFGLLIVPITMGVGKEYAIYVTNQYTEYMASGRSEDEVWRMVGRRAGAALAIATITSVSGLVAMFLAGFHIMRDLAFLSIFAFTSLFVLSITFIPAAQSLRKKKAKHKAFKPSRLMGGICRAIQRNRTITVVAAVLITGGLAYESLQLEEYFGISGGFKKGDYVEESYQFYNNALGGSGTELVVIEGDIAQPSTIDYLTKLDQSLVSDTKHIPKASNVNSLMLGLRTYYAIKDGLASQTALNNVLIGPPPACPPSPAPCGPAQSDANINIPKDPNVIRQDIKFMYNSPIWAPLAAIFVSPDADYAVTHAFYKIDKETYDGLKDDWNALNCDVQDPSRPYVDAGGAKPCAPGQGVARPSTVKNVDLVGTQDTFYLFVEYGMPWLTKVGYIASALTLVIAFVVLRKPRDILAVMVPMTLAGVWWLGLLPIFGIKASMTLMLPTVMLISVGSDYAIQYVWNYRELGSMEEVYRTTGKANLFVVIATVIAFILFVPMKLVLSSQGALAAALAIVTIFVTTTLVVPLFYPEAGQRSRVVVEEVQAEDATQDVAVRVQR